MSAEHTAERRLTDAALRESNELLAQSQRLAHLGHYVLDAATGTWTASAALVEIFGIEAAYVRDVEGWLGIVHADDRDAMRTYVLEHVMRDHHLFDRQYRIARISDGAERWVHGLGTLELDDTGEVARMFGVIQDITEGKLAEDALRETNQRLEAVLKNVTTTMGKVVEVRDAYTQGHQQSVATLARQIAEEMNLSERDIEGIEIAALVHDIGKLSVPLEILTKPAALSAAEFALIKEHPQTGFEILRDIDYLWPVADIALQHHERMDGSGYPNGLLGEEILLGARIVAVADVIEAMASHRPYRPALGLQVAVSEIADNPDKYDVDVAAACLRLYEAGRIAL